MRTARASRHGPLLLDPKIAVDRARETCAWVGAAWYLIHGATGLERWGTWVLPNCCPRPTRLLG